MIEIRRLLCPVDYSDFSRHAFEYAVAIARWYGSTITALHVVPPIAAPIPSGDTFPPLPASPVDLERMRQELEAFVAPLAGDVPCDTLVVEGSIGGEIQRQAERLPADLLVMGTHGRSGFDRLLLGSMTEKLLRRAPCPVLTVPLRVADAPSTGGQIFSRILCGVDFAPASLRALAYAASLAAEANARLTVMHVLEPVPVFEPVVAGGPGGAPYDPQVRQAVKQKLAEVVPEDARTFSHVTEVVTVGKPYRELLRAAAEERSELLVLGAHGGRLGLAAFGSTTNHVVREAGCPVLTLRG